MLVLQADRGVLLWYNAGREDAQLAKSFPLSNAAPPSLAPGSGRKIVDRLALTA